MCVIFVVEKDDQRPTEDEVAKAFSSNPAGAGVAWREGKEIHWAKGLDLEEVQDSVATLTAPFIAHFRIPTCGGSYKGLTHPFPVEQTTSLALCGSTTSGVLFHNGHWTGWDDKTLNVALKSGVKLPAGHWSDSRALAWVASIVGEGILDMADEKVAVFTPAGIRLYGGNVGSKWLKIDGRFIASNDHWRTKGNWRQVHGMGGGSYMTNDPPKDPIIPKVVPRLSDGNKPIITSSNEVKVVGDGVVALVPKKVADPGPNDIPGGNVPLSDIPFPQVEQMYLNKEIGRRQYKTRRKLEEKRERLKKEMARRAERWHLTHSGVGTPRLN